MQHCSQHPFVLQLPLTRVTGAMLDLVSNKAGMVMSDELKCSVPCRLMIRARQKSSPALWQRASSCRVRRVTQTLNVQHQLKPPTLHYHMALPKTLR